MRQKQLIQMPVFPEALKPQLCLLSDSMVAALQNDGLSMEEGIIDLGDFPQPLRFPFFFARWFGQFDEVFHNLNLTLTDIDELPLNHVVLSGSPRHRFYLLVRTFFYEFYRAREIFNSGLKGLANHGLIAANSIRETRNTFHAAFEETIKIRNNLVHGLGTWPGKANTILNQVCGAWELGYAVHEIESGKQIDIGNVIKAASEEYLPLLIAEANRLCGVLQAVLDECLPPQAA